MKIKEWPAIILGKKILGLNMFWETSPPSGVDRGASSPLSPPLGVPGGGDRENTKLKGNYA